MRSTYIPIVLLTGLFSCAAPNATPSVDISGSYGTEYVFRGATQNEKGAVQGEVTAAVDTENGSMFATFWGHMDHGNDTGDAVLPDGNGGKFSEIDTIAGYSFGTDEIGMEVGVIGYQFPNGVGGSTNEAYFSVSLNELPLAPSFAAYYDFDAVEGFYASGSIGHGIELSNELSLDMGVNLGWSNSKHSGAYYGVGSSGLADLGGSLGVTWARDDKPSVGLAVVGSSIIDDDLAAGLDSGANDSDTVYVMLTVSHSY